MVNNVNFDKIWIKLNFQINLFYYVFRYEYGESALFFVVVYFS